MSVDSRGYDTSASAIAANSTYDNNVSNYGAFSGVNIIAHINHVPVGSIMGISYTVHSEKQAQYTFGDANPRSFVTGKRGIAGTLIFNQFDRDPLIYVFAGSNGAGLPLLDYAKPSGYSNTAFGAYGATGDATTISGEFNPLSAHTTSFGGTNGSAAYENAVFNDIDDAYDAAYKVPLEYADQLPPFDVTLTMMNNQGKGAYMVMYGIEIINQGGGFTIDDLRNEVAYTYVARGIRPLTPISPIGQPLVAPALSKNTSLFS